MSASPYVLAGVQGGVQGGAQGRTQLALVVMAKAPVPGAAKTRLVPALGAEGAAALAACLLTQALDQACAAAPAGAVTLSCAPDTRHAAFSAAQARHPGLRLRPQAEGDLGQRMHLALLHGLHAAEHVLLMGTDAPAIDAAMLRQAAAALNQVDAVFVPAHDGGYALVGLRRPAPFLFAAMPWSTPQVMAVSRQRLQAAGWRWAALPAVHDIDEPADLVHLPAAWARLPPMVQAAAQAVAAPVAASASPRTVPGPR